MWQMRIFYATFLFLFSYYIRGHGYSLKKNLCASINRVLQVFSAFQHIWHFDMVGVIRTKTYPTEYQI